jgi:metal-responsive CopG/Arc/MetJ family transcriptional regulator
MMDKKLVQFGVTFPRDLLARIDNAKGKYLSRNKYILKILEESLDEKEEVGVAQKIE